MKRGDVVLVDWIYSNRVGSKSRPTLAVQSDALNMLIPDTVLVAITGKGRAAVTEVVLDPGQEPQAGLTRLSYAVCNNLSTLDQSLIHRRMGELSPAAVRQIEAKLKTALELP